MALSISDTYKLKRESKIPRRRRATVDNACLRPKQRTQRRLSMPLKKSVQFTELSQVCIFEPSSPKTWYTGEDHQRFKKERKSDVVSFREQSRQKMDSLIKQPLASSCCPVGLEQLLSAKGVIEANYNRKAAVQSVLFEQNQQRLFGIQDPVQIAILSVRFSAGALERAQRRGRFQEMAKFV